jgi:hypothetical protein
MNEQIESLLEEKTDIVNDLWRFGKDLNDYTYDTLSNRIEMIDFMLAAEGYYKQE